MVGRELGLAGDDGVEAVAGLGVDPGTLGQAGVGEGGLPVQAADGSEDHPALLLALLAAALVQFGDLEEYSVNQRES